MREFRTTRLVHHAAQNMFNLVADVESYPQFVPLCDQLKIRSTEEKGENTVLVADMTIAYKVIQETFKTKVTLNRQDKKISVEYLDGPFKTLNNVWSFAGQDEGQCEVDFYIAYEFRSLPLQLLAGAAFDKVFRKMTKAFEDRADKIYGKRLAS